MLSLDDSVEKINGIGPKRAEELNKAGFFSVNDLIHFFPFRYEDRSKFISVANLKENESATIKGEIHAQRLYLPRRNFTIYEIKVRDDSGSVKAVFFNQPFLKSSLTPGKTVVLHGPVKAARTRDLCFMNPQYEILERGDGLHTGRVVPIYSRIGEIPPKALRSALSSALQSIPAELPELVPEGVRARLGFHPYGEALREVHFPSSQDFDALNEGRSRAHMSLAFSEFFRMQLGVLMHRKKQESLKAFRLDGASRVAKRFDALLPFQLTTAQERVLFEILQDLEKPFPMNRLLQGEVASGKTIVALLAIVAAVECGHQAALMVPTELLAEQHYRNIRRLFQKTDYRSALLTGSVTRDKRREILEGIAKGDIHLVIGTHAVIQEKVEFLRLGLAVVDEQHRFGVIHRWRITEKGFSPHLLLMTATPIPRTLALALYGDMTISTLDELPFGRLPITTLLKGEKERGEVYEMLETEIGKGNQAYIILPLIEESEKLDEVKAASAMHRHLQESVFPKRRIGLIHGRLSAEQREDVMNLFFRREIDILVSTTVIEVGIDVPSVSFMIIENAERFGLSQLHQMRGRIGRGNLPSVCVILIGPHAKPEARARLEFLEKSSGGLEIAERDLEVRGPGDFFGTRQSGVPGFHVTAILKFPELLSTARQEALRYLEGPRRKPDANVEEALRYWESHFRLGDIG
jgi:ATP-dependent DNA helicase RecG